MQYLTQRELVHTDDPRSSYDALERSSAVRLSHCANVLELVRESPKCTSAELARYSEYDLTETRRRLTDLKNQGLVIREDSRTCRISGKRACAWLAVE